MAPKYDEFPPVNTMNVIIPTTPTSAGDLLPLDIPNEYEIKNTRYSVKLPSVAVFIHPKNVKPIKPILAQPLPATNPHDVELSNMCE